MIWLTWRQFRGQAWLACAALAVAAAALAVTGLHLAHLYDISGIATCHAHGICQTVANTFINQAGAAYGVLFYGGIAVMYAVPAIIGVFWGAPLVSREIEAGTFRLAWNQSVTRTRWLAVKLALIGLAAMATAGLLSLMISWWASPIDQALPLAAGPNDHAVNRFTPLLFGARGITPIGYAAFAFTAGVTAGVLIRRALPAMATTLAVFTGALVTMSLWIRPHLITPVRATLAVTTANMTGVANAGGGRLQATAIVNIPGAWMLSSQTITATGQTSFPATHACSASSSFQACQAYIGSLHLRQLVTYQPASRYWTFQWYEMAIFLALALALTGACFWWVRHRRLS